MKNIVSNISLAFIGAVVPDNMNYRNPAFSPAGNMCQLSLLKGLKNAGLDPSVIISVIPIPSFPSDQRLWSGKNIINLTEDIQAIALPYLNIMLIKQIFIGVAALYELVFWGWKSNNGKQKVIYTYNISVPPGLVILMAAWFTRSKVIAMVYDINVPGETVPDTWRWNLDYWLHKILLPKYSALVVINDSIIDDFSIIAPFLRVEGGINPSDNTEKEHNFLHSKQDIPFTVVFAGALTENNGVLLLLDAFTKLKGEPYRLAIAGRGPLEGMVREAASRDNRIEYFGFITHQEVMHLYNRSHLLVNIRLIKSVNTKYLFPSKIMEYLASGIPVMTTCLGSMTEEYTRFAYILEGETPREVAETIRYVASLPVEERIKKSLSAKRYMLNHKTWDAQSRKIVQFIESVVT